MPRASDRHEVGDGFGMKPLLASSEELHFNSSHGHPDDPIPMTGNLHSCKSDDPDDSECLCKGQWLCEPALWLEWVCVGCVGGFCSVGSAGELAAPANSKWPG